MNVGKNLRKARLAKEMSLLDLAKKAGVTKSFISMLESGKRGFTVATLEKLAKALRINPSDLMR